MNIDAQDILYKILATINKQAINGNEKIFDKIQQNFIIETLRKLVIEENFLNLIKDIYQ